MNTFYNGLPITKENLLSLIKECMEAGWEGSSLHRSTEIALEKMYYGGYEGWEEDIEYILYKLNSKPAYGNGYFYPKPNLLDVESIISGEGWFFQEVEE